MLQLSKADTLTDRELNSLRDWLGRPTGGNSFLVGEEAKV